MQLALARDEVHLWLAWVSRSNRQMLAEACREVASAAEWARCNRFRAAADRDMALMSRLMLRQVLSCYAPVAPADWAFADSDTGKPGISGPASQLAFNLSHSGGCVAMAVAVGTSVGVDVERVRYRDVQKLARRFFSSTEAADVCSLPERQGCERFYDYWTLKESWLKATGTGLRTALDSFSFSLSPTGEISLSGHASRRDHWFHWLLDAGATHRLALSLARVGAAAPRQSTFEWTPGQGFRRIELSQRARSGKNLKPVNLLENPLELAGSPR